MLMSNAPACAPNSVSATSQELAIASHFDPVWGTPFWLERVAALGVNPGAIRSLRDLHDLGGTTQADLLSRPLSDFIPRRYHDRLHEFVIGQTGGTTGPGAWTAYREDEFHAAFIEPFIVAARHVGFPRRQPWLYVGPSGPHIIGKAMQRLARALESPDPFSVDFDPRWAKKLPPGSFAQERYLRHVVEQAMHVIERQPIGVLFTTPPVLARLVREMTESQRLRIRGVHYGGIALSPALLREFQEQWLPESVHLSGYGNTLFGCALELNPKSGRELDYFPFGDRLILEVVDDEGQPVAEGRGRVRFTRLDESFLILRMLAPVQ
jgi:phenylacetate-coenzyme A ligase PaaK-like adenylate-forming protein